MRVFQGIFNRPVRPEPRGPDGPVDGWKTAREALISDPRSAYLRIQPYAVRNPALIDPTLQSVLDRIRRYGGEMPQRRHAVLGVVRQARASYGNLIRNPEARAEIEGHVRAHYLAPTTEETDRVLTVDLGVAPGVFTEIKRRNWEITQSDVADGSEWRTSEIGKKLVEYGAQHPAVPVISFHILVPQGSMQRRWNYRWIRPQDRIAVYRSNEPNAAYVTGPLNQDLEPFVTGFASLSIQGLRKMTKRGQAWGDDVGIPL